MKCSVLLGLQAVAFWPAVLWFYRRSRYADGGAWELIPLALAALFVLLNLRHMRPPGRRGRWCLLGVLVAFVVLRPLLTPFAGSVLACSIFCGTVVSMMPRKGGALGLVGLSLLALPVLSIMQYQFGYPLRVLVASMAAPVLRSTGLDVIREGTCLAWDGRLVWVDAPCSGLRMLWSGLLLVCALACFLRLDLKRSGLALGTALVGVVLANILRTAILFFDESEIVPLPLWYHQFIGLVIHAAALVLLYVLVHRLRESQCAPGLPT